METLLAWRPSLFACTALAALAFATGAAHAQTSGRGDLLPGSGDPRSVNVSLFSGSVGEAIPIEVAPSRKNFKPRLNLAYSSLGGMTELGLGWQLDVGRIERSTKNGVPGLTDDDLFQFSVGGSAGELTPVGGGAYRARVETQYRTFARVGDGWTMRDAAGTLFSFGTTAAARVADGSVPVVWQLDAIEDLNGNTVSITYNSDGNVLYVADIRYTGHRPSGEAGPNLLHFDYEARPDVTSSYARGVRQDRARRLSLISVYAADGSLVRRYRLDYSQSPANNRSLLQRLLLVGADDSSTAAARTYQYFDRLRGWDAADRGALPRDLVNGDGVDTGLRVMDVNGDNIADLVVNGADVLLGDATGNYTSSPSYGASLQAANVQFSGDNGIDGGTRLMDVNGDLRPDLVVATLSRREVLLNDGRGWNHDDAFSASLDGLTATIGLLTVVPDGDGGTTDTFVPTDIHLSFVQSSGDFNGVDLADVNGDGKPDLVWSNTSTGGFDGTDQNGNPIRLNSADIRTVYLNTGSGWVRDPSLSAALGPFTFVVNTQLQGYDLLDVNGDGLSDIVRTLDGEAREVFLGTGRQWIRDDAYSASLAAAPLVSLNGDRKNQGLYPLDFNGDGKIDYIRAGGGVTTAYRNTGTGWALDDDMAANLVSLGLALVDGDGVPTGVGFADLDGDGATDVFSAKTGSPHFSHASRIAGVDLLQAALSALGEVTTVDYVPSSLFDNRGGDEVEDFPRVLPVASTMTRQDGLGSSFAYSFGYAGGRFVGSDFRGFAQGTRQDPNGAKNIGNFHQLEEELAGQLSSTEVRDDMGALWSRRSFQFEIVSPVAGVSQGRSVQTDEETFDQGVGTLPAGTLHTRMLTTYDDFLNVTEIDKLGDVDVVGDEIRMTVTHAFNATLGVADPPVRLSQYDGANNLIASSVTFYDGLPEGQIVRGNSTSIVDAVEIGGPSRTRSFSYDKYGNVITATDALGGVTQFQYDSLQAAFRAKTTDPLGHVMKDEFDPRFDIVVSETDANGKIATKTLDAFGRMIEERLPGDESSPNGTRALSYVDVGLPGTQGIVVRSTETAGQPGTFDTRTFLDGFGQVFRIESEGTAGRTVVVETSFDDGGNPIATSDPHFSDEPGHTNSFTRDILRRIVQAVDPSGAVRTMTYFGGTYTEVVDKRGNVGQFRRNAYGKTVEEHLFVGGSDQATAYTYDALNQLVKVTDGAGQVTNIRYDAIQRRTSLDDPSLGHFEYRYDVNNNLINQTDGAGKVTQFQYNAINQLTRKQFPDGKAIDLSYDGPAGSNSAARLAKVVDQAGVLEIAYDARGNIAKHTRHIGDKAYLTGYAYDPMGRLRQLVYPDGFNVSYAYNPASYVDSVTDGDGKPIVSNLQYNAVGQITHSQFANGVTADEGYDASSRLQRLTSTDPYGQVLQDLRNGFDPAGNVTSIGDLLAGKTQSFTYDEKNQLVRAVGPWGDEAYAYDVLGNLQHKGSLFMAYDATRRQQLSCGIDATIDVKHSPPKATDELRALEPAFDRCFDGLRAGLPAQAVSALNSDRSKQTLARLASAGLFVASYDSHGNLVQKNDEHYEYDYENHLVRVSRNNASVEENVFDYQGSRVIRRDTNNGAAVSQSLYIDKLFELHDEQAFRHVRLGGDIVASVRTSAAQVRLISDSDLAAVMVFTLGAPPDSGPACAVGGHRSPAGPLSLALLLVLVARLVRPPARKVEARRRLRRRLLAAARGSLGVLRRRPGRFLMVFFLIAAQFLMSGGKVYAANNEPDAGGLDQRFYYHADHVGSVQVITDGHARVVQQNQYKPFGEQLRLSNGDGQTRGIEFAFQGRRADGTGFLEYGARQYDPHLGRFLSADTQVPDAESPQTLHRYAFNLNNPIRFVDPTGHGFWDVFVAILVVVLVVVAVVIVVVGAPVFGPLLVAVATGALIGAAIGAGVGLIVASVALATGHIGSVQEFLNIIVAGTFIGLLAGAGLVATFGLAGAPAASPLLGTILTGAATGAGSLAIKNGPGQNRGFGEDFMKGLFVGSIIGAASSAAGYGTASFLGLSTSGILSWSTAFGLGYSFGMEAGAKALGIVDPTSWWAIAKRAYNATFGKDTPDDSVETTSQALTAPGVPGWSFPGGAGFGIRKIGGTMSLNAIPLAL